VGDRQWQDIIQPWTSL